MRITTQDGPEGAPGRSSWWGWCGPPLPSCRAGAVLVRLLGSAAGLVGRFGSAGPRRSPGGAGSRAYGRAGPSAGSPLDSLTGALRERSRSDARARRERPAREEPPRLDSGQRSDGGARRAALLIPCPDPSEGDLRSDARESLPTREGRPRQPVPCPRLTWRFGVCHRRRSPAPRPRQPTRPARRETLLMIGRSPLRERSQIRRAPARREELPAQPRPSHLARPTG